MADSEESVDLQKFKVADLKRLLKEKGLLTTGNKAELIERLKSGAASGGAEDVAEELDEDVLNEDDEDVIGDEALEEEEVEEEEEEEEEEEAEAEADTIKENGNNKESTEVTQTSSNAEKPAVTRITMDSSTDAKTDDVGSQALLKRAERFGVVAPEAKKVARAERFGIPVTSTASTNTSSKGAASAPIAAVSAPDLEKLKKRADRFGNSVSSVMSKAEDVDKLKKRAERFGAVTSDKLSKLDQDERALKRKMRFGSETTGLATADTDEKKQKRADRFKLPS